MFVRLTHPNREGLLTTVDDNGDLSVNIQQTFQPASAYSAVAPRSHYQVKWLFEVLSTTSHTACHWLQIPSKV